MEGRLARDAHLVSPPDADCGAVPEDEIAEGRPGAQLLDPIRRAAWLHRRVGRAAGQQQQRDGRREGDSHE